MVDREAGGRTGPSQRSDHSTRSESAAPRRPLASAAVARGVSARSGSTNGLQACSTASDPAGSVEGGVVKFPNHRRVKAHMSYTLEEAADCLHVHVQTMRQWIKRGLPVARDRFPMLMRGRDLIAFLCERKARSQRSCKPGEAWPRLRCREPRRFAGDEARYEPLRGDAGRIAGYCATCNCRMNRGVNRHHVEQVRGDVHITFTRAVRRIYDHDARLATAHSRRA